MHKGPSRYRWFVVGIFFLFMLLHQSDRLLIGPLTPAIIKEFNLTYTQVGRINSGALIVGAILYPVWGVLYDRYSRAKLLALASLIWGSTTWLAAVARSYPQFLISRASTGIDDSSYPGLFSLVADYFGPKLRGKVYGLLQLTAPIGYLMGLIMALLIAPGLGWNWRQIFYLTGGLGIILAAVIFFAVRDIPRGQAEPEFEGAAEVGQFKFSWAQVGNVFRKRTMWFICLQGFAGVFPWNVITAFFFTYLALERGYDSNAIFITMAPVILILASGYFLGGAVGDWAFRRTPRGRIIVSSVGVLMGAIFLYLAVMTPVNQPIRFFILMSLTAIFMPLSSPNVTSTVYDITVPEVRSTAQAIEYFIESSGAALAPILAGTLADKYSLGSAIVWICVSAWLVCFLFYLGALFTVKRDNRSLRDEMVRRATLPAAASPATGD
jgi:MFS transporter, Spinster family, sphingosine-1-phosphate transporter